MSNNSARCGWPASTRNALGGHVLYANIHRVAQAYRYCAQTTAGSFPLFFLRSFLPSSYPHYLPLPAPPALSPLPPPSHSYRLFSEPHLPKGRVAFRQGYIAARRQCISSFADCNSPRSLLPLPLRPSLNKLTNPTYYYPSYIQSCPPPPTLPPSLKSRPLPSLASSTAASSSGN